MSTTHGIKLDEETAKRLKTLGEVRDRSPHWLMKTAIEQYLIREEHYEREKQEDAQRWQHYQLTGEAIAHDVATKWLTALAQSEEVACPQ